MDQTAVRDCQIVEPPGLEVHLRDGDDSHFGSMADEQLLGIDDPELGGRFDEPPPPARRDRWESSRRPSTSHRLAIGKRLRRP